ncbi:hypothetical protein QTP88_024197 [Uroleucon formosanum]
MIVLGESPCAKTYKNSNSYSNYVYTWNRSYGFRISAASVDGRSRADVIFKLQPITATNGRTPQNTDDDDNQPLNANIAMTNENHRGYLYYGHGRRYCIMALESSAVIEN